MLLQLVVGLALGAIFCLTPLALYLSWLAAVNRRPSPTILSGGWDLVGTLAGLSGFLLFGGGIVVAAVESNVRFALRGNWAQIQEVWGQERVSWAAIALGYVLILAGSVGLALLNRFSTLSVYNLRREDAEAMIDETLAEAGVPAVRQGNLWSAGRDVLRIDPFPPFRHVSFRILTPDPLLAEEIDRVLREKIARAQAAGGPVSGWLYSAALVCTLSVVCSLLLLTYIVYLTR